MIKTELDRFVADRELIASLEMALAKKRLSQAVLIEGRRGSGKKTLAGLLAAGLVCRGENKPCGKCSACKKVKTGHPDIITLSGGEKGNVTVDDIRGLRKQAFIAPNESECKVFIITGKLPPASQNALLKILEEPPHGVHIIIAAEHREQLLDTVLSRCSLIELKALPPERVEEYLKREFPDADRQTVKSASLCCEGNIGAARDLVLKRDGSEEKTVSDMLFAAARGDAVAFTEASLPLEKDAALFALAAEKMSLALRDAVIIKEKAGNPLSPFLKEADALAKSKTSKKLAELYGVCSECSERLLQNPKINLLLALFCARMTG